MAAAMSATGNSTKPVGRGSALPPLPAKSARGAPPAPPKATPRVATRIDGGGGASLLPPGLTKMQQIKWRKQHSQAGSATEVTRTPPVPSRVPGPSTCAAIDLASALFDLIDVDGGGDLDEKETKRYLKAMGVAQADLNTRWKASA